MRIVHSSDWHLGLSHGATARGADHDLFLAWLGEQLRELGADALLVAGDVFDSMQPSADALARYYRFLATAASTGVRHVVITGGNHDSASRLDAPAEVLQALSVHVVGGIGGDPESWRRCLVPLRDADQSGVQGKVTAVVLAVPYVHEWRLGVRTTDLDTAAVRAAFTQRFGAVYSWLCDQAHATWPGVPLVGMGHLTLGPASREDYPHEIHQVGSIESLPDSVLDGRMQYVALGHIHRSYPVAQRRGWYCGSPVAVSLPESRTPRRVLCVDLDPDPGASATVTPVLVPTFRALRELTGPPDQLVADVAGLSWSEPLPPLLFCRAVCDTPQPDLSSRLYDALSAFPESARPVLVELRDVRPGDAASEDESPPPPALADLTVADVFAELCRARGIAEPEPLQAAFATLSSAGDAELEALCARVRAGEAP